MENEEEAEVSRTAADYLTDKFQQVMAEHNGQPDAHFKALAATLDLAVYLINGLNQIAIEAAAAAEHATLTAEEREAVAWAIVAADLEKTETVGEFSAFCAERAATLRGLLERTK